MKVVFMGTPDFAVNVLQGLIDNYDVVGVVSQPDKKVGRKQILTNTPVKELALKYNIPYLIIQALVVLMYMRHYFLNLGVVHLFIRLLLMDIRKLVLLLCIWMLKWIMEILLVKVKLKYLIVII